MSRQPDFAGASARRAHVVEPASRWWVVLGGAVLLLALIAAWRVEADLDQARAALVSARSAAASRQERAESGRAASAAARFAAQARLSTSVPPPRVLAALQALQPPGVRLERIALHYGETLDLEIEVHARQAGEYDRFLAALETAPEFATVTPGAENREGEVRSSLALRYVARDAQ